MSPKGAPVRKFFNMRILAVSLRGSRFCGRNCAKTMKTRISRKEFFSWGASSHRVPPAMAVSQLMYSTSRLERARLQPCRMWHQRSRALATEGTRSSPSLKCSNFNDSKILPVSLTRSRFCGESFSAAQWNQDFTGCLGEGAGQFVSGQRSVVSGESKDPTQAKGWAWMGHRALSSEPSAKSQLPATVSD